MKKLVLFFAVFSALVVSSCSNRDSEVDAENEKHSQEEVNAGQEELDSLNNN
jgi:outer membrane murein-binding lipoprotein Lpp